MATIIKHPEVKDYFVEITLAEAVKRPEGIADLYEDGKAVIVKDYKLDLDYDFLNGIDFTITDDSMPADIKKLLQKMQHKYFAVIDPSGQLNRIQKAMVDSFFAGSVEEFSKFCAQARSAYEQILKLRTDLFPHYRFENDVSLTYRFTETLFENIHWDSFPDYPDKHQVRFFTNLDKTPRLWNMSHNLYEYLDKEYEQLGLEKYRYNNPNTVIAHIDREVLGGMRNRCLDDLPKHHVAFEQGDVWFADSRALSHQIYYGKRAIIYSMEAEVESMVDPDKRFDRRIALLHEQHAKAGAASAVSSL